MRVAELYIRYLCCPQYAAEEPHLSELLPKRLAHPTGAAPRRLLAIPARIFLLLFSSIYTI